MKRVSGFPEITEDLKKELKAVADIDDADIDTSDIPEWTDEEYARSAELTALYKPRKQQITARIDADVLKWLKGGGRRYQTRLNEILREAMLRDYRKKARGTTRKEHTGRS